jgi:hypothetical protein
VDAIPLEEVEEPIPLEEVEEAIALEPVSSPDPETNLPLEMANTPDASRSRPPAPQWLFRPVPASEPDPHPESAVVALKTADGGRLSGARVRGKKHKHEGTNCDDWFEAASAGGWTMIAVADGAGSRRLSRLGARVSCQRAVDTLNRELAKVRVTDRPSADALLKRDEAQTSFVDPEIAAVQRALSLALTAAHFAVESAADKLKGSTAHERLVGRAVAPEDLSATLLLAAHTTLRVGGSPHDLVLACQVGDGAAAVMDRRGKVHVLGVADSGAYSGETDFLTSRRQIDPANLHRRIVGHVGQLRAVMVMTDGVADDYFPSDPGLARLYADLVLNGILPPDTAAVGTGGLAFDPADGRADGDVEVPAESGPLRVRLRSAATFASEQGVSPESLAASPAWLRAGAKGTPLLEQAATPEERLRLWLDAYQVRGSFDDRTLVVLDCGRTS